MFSAGIKLQLLCAKSASACGLKADTTVYKTFYMDMKSMANIKT